MPGSAGADKTQIAETLPRPAIRLLLVLTHNNSNNSRDKVPASGASAVTTNNKWFHGDKSSC